VHLVTDADGAPHLELADPANPAPPTTLAERVLQELRSGGQPLTREALRSRLRVNNQRLGEVLEELERDGRVRRSPKGWSAS
jgi:hypothetical protein